MNTTILLGVLVAEVIFAAPVVARWYLTLAPQVAYLINTAAMAMATCFSIRSVAGL